MSTTLNPRSVPAGTAHVELVEPRAAVPIESARPFPCSDAPRARDPRETKGEGDAAANRATRCDPSGSCC